MKKKVLLLATLLVMATMTMAQQSISVSYKGQQPVITDFVNAILSQRELNEALDKSDIEFFSF